MRRGALQAQTKDYGQDFGGLADGPPTTNVNARRRAVFDAARPRGALPEAVLMSHGTGGFEGPATVMAGVVERGYEH